MPCNSDVKAWRLDRGDRRELGGRGRTLAAEEALCPLPQYPPLWYPPLSPLRYPPCCCIRVKTLLVGDTITEDTNAFSENAISKKNMAKIVRALNFLIFRNTKNTVSKNALVSST